MLAPIMAARIVAALRRVKLGADPLGPHTTAQAAVIPSIARLRRPLWLPLVQRCSFWLLLLKEEPQHLAAGIRPAGVGVGAGWASS